MESRVDSSNQEDAHRTQGRVAQIKNDGQRTQGSVAQIKNGLKGRKLGLRRF